MPTITYPLIASFSSDNTGQAANIVCTVTDNNGSGQFLGDLTWTEETDAAGNATTGTYTASGQFDTSWAYPIKVSVAVTGLAGVVSVQYIKAVDLAILDGAGNLIFSTQPIVDAFGNDANVSGGAGILECIAQKVRSNAGGSDSEVSLDTLTDRLVEGAGDLNFNNTGQSSALPANVVQWTGTGVGDMPLAASGYTNPPSTGDIAAAVQGILPVEFMSSAEQGELTTAVDDLSTLLGRTDTASTVTDIQAAIAAIQAAIAAIQAKTDALLLTNGLVDVNDKTGFSLADAQAFSTSGSVGSVTGSVGSVTSSVTVTLPFATL